MEAAVVPVSPDSHFSLQNIPFGVFSPPNTLKRHIGTAIGKHALSLTALAPTGLLRSEVIEDESVFLKVNALVEYWSLKLSCAFSTLDIFWVLGRSQ
jgi:Fumarylacetoacetase N-terminal